MNKKPCFPCKATTKQQGDQQRRKGRSLSERLFSSRRHHLRYGVEGRRIPAAVARRERVFPRQIIREVRGGPRFQTHGPRVSRAQAGAHVRGAAAAAHGSRGTGGGGVLQGTETAASANPRRRRRGANRSALRARATNERKQPTNISKLYA